MLVSLKWLHDGLVTIWALEIMMKKRNENVLLTERSCSLGIRLQKILVGLANQSYYLWEEAAGLLIDFYMFFNKQMINYQADLNIFKKDCAIIWYSIQYVISSL